MWKTLNGIGRQKVLFANKNNDFTIDLGSDWGTVEFFITINHIKYPQILNSISYNITKLTNRRYKISPIIKGADFAGWRDYYGTNINDRFNLNCYGFKYSWGCSIERTNSNTGGGGLDLYINNKFNRNVYSESTLNYEGFMSPWGQHFTITSSSGYINLGNYNECQFRWRTLIDTMGDGNFKWKVKINPVQEITIVDSSDVSLTILAIETTTLNSTKSVNFPWKDVSILHFKSNTFNIPKSENFELYLPNYSKSLNWINSNMVGGAISLYNPNSIIGEYNFNINRLNDNKYTVSNTAKTYKNFSIITNESNLNNFSLYNVSDVSIIVIYVWDTSDASTDSCDLKIYNNGILIGNIKGLGDSNYNNGDTMKQYYLGRVQYNYRGGVTIVSYYSLPIPEYSMTNNNLHLTWNGSYPPNTFKNGVNIKIGKSSYYLSEGVKNTTYNEALVYAYEESRR